MPIILPAALTNPPVKKLLPVIVPVATIAFVPELNVNPALASASPLLLYKTCVFDPGTTILPLILPWKLPKKYPWVEILPVALIIPAVNKLPVLVVAVTLKLLNIPTLVILGCAFVVTVLAVPAV